MMIRTMMYAMSRPHSGRLVPEDDSREESRDSSYIDSFPLANNHGLWEIALLITWVRESVMRMGLASRTINNNNNVRVPAASRCRNECALSVCGLATAHQRTIQVF